MIVNGSHSETGPIAVTRVDVSEALIELWSRIFEAELGADLAREAEAFGELHRLRAIERGVPADLDVDGDRDHVGG